MSPKEILEFLERTTVAVAELELATRVGKLRQLDSAPAITAAANELLRAADAMKAEVLDSIVIPES